MAGPRACILGVGVDIVHLPRVAAAARRWGVRFERRILGPGELDALQRLRGEPGAAAGGAAGAAGEAASARFLASRWAAKEAAYKALGAGPGPRVQFPDLQVERGTGGRPELRLVGTARRRMQELGADQAHLSISHDHEYAIAHVIIERTV
jgi:holo-[acyl-carrier protein] synthase